MLQVMAQTKYYYNRFYKHVVDHRQYWMMAIGGCFILVALLTSCGKTSEITDTLGLGLMACALL